MEDTYYIVMMIVFLGLIVLPLLLLRKAKEEKGKKADSGPRLVNKTPTTSSVPVSPAVSRETGTSKEIMEVKTVYRFIPEVYLTGDKKWKCDCCDTENSRMTEYCELCGSSIRNGK